MTATTTVDETTKIDWASVKLKRGQYVRHPKYGWGTILERDGNQTLVSFRTVGIKRLATSSASFDMVGGEALKKKAVA